MTLPNSIDPSTPLGSSARSLGDDQIRALKQAILDIIGIPSTTSIEAALFEVVTNGLKSVIFQDLATDPDTAGYMRRSGTKLKYHDSTTTQTIAFLTDLLTITLTNKTGATRAPGDVVGIDSSNDSAVTLADTVNTIQQLVVAAETILNNASGRWYQIGVATVKVASAVTRGNYLVKSATTVVAEDGLTAATASNDPPAGAFAVALTGNAAGPGQVQAMMMGLTKPPNKAPASASYVVLALDSTLTAERRLQVASGIESTDGGANGDVTLISTSRVLDRVVTSVDVKASTTETTIYTVTVGPGLLSTNKRIVLEMQVRLTGANVANETHYCTFRVKYDGTTIAEINPYTHKHNGTSSFQLSNTACLVRVILQASGATNSQMGMIECGPAYLGVLDAFADFLIFNASSGRISSSSVDSTVGKTLSITARLSHAGAADEVLMENAILKLE